MTLIQVSDLEDLEDMFLQKTIDLQSENFHLNENLATLEAEAEELRRLVREFADALIQHTTELGYTPKAFEHLPAIVQQSRVAIRGLHLIKKDTHR